MSTIEHRISSGNVFADLGLKDAETLYARAVIGGQVVMALEKRGDAQAATAQVLGIEPAQVSDLMCGRFHRFNQQQLIGFLIKLGLKTAAGLGHPR
ncbi:XRE family transcriptional regulator [Lamprobacter modestohalophilus]|uniref:helix-turn-helix domain-containing protein n=1 Tax=Lamprobacter modestohalophilus TaxID=1064514 RepID=UPI002ADED8E4|nr:XRE family transcriptional regulator [Lamprobacter modestohalophilus]MEA1053700.1 XRE family transcriptional regulator [Lamprobacter modestohalophilus]